MQDDPTSQPEDPAVGEPGDGETGSVESADAEAPGSTRPVGMRRRVLLVAAPLVAFASLAAVMLVDREPPPAPTTTTSITTSTTTTTAPTTTIPRLPAGTVEVATARGSVPVLRVRSAPPPGWDAMPLSVVADSGELPPPSEDENPPRPALPRPDLPVSGRFARDGGWEFHNPGPYEPAQPFTMLVEERRGDWIEVHVPVRPNSTRGWVAANDVEVSTVSHRIEVRLGERSLRAWAGDQLLAETPVAVGTDFSRTPTGVFYVTDIVPQANPGGSYGPVALATDGYSEMMDQFATGVPVIALHGTNRPAGLGKAVSNGCIRMPNEVVEQLAAELPRGTPVLIWP